MPRKLRVLRRGTALTRAEKKEQGPVQIIVVGFDDLKLGEQVIAELRRLNKLEVVRLVDAVIVTKSKSSELVRVPATDPTTETSQAAGAAAALIGLEDEIEEGTAGTATATVEARGFVGDERTWSVADAIPPGTMAVVALIEHRWAIPVGDAVRDAGGQTLADAWVHPDDLAAFTAAPTAKGHRKAHR
jgi:uncharacterized membrane protein